VRPTIRLVIGRWFAVALLAGGLSVAAAGLAGASVSRTQTHIFQAFTASGKPAIHVTRSERGSCWVGSIAINRDDAWRCASGNALYDPCFSSSKARGIVVCPLAPWQTSGVELKLTKRLPQPNPAKASTTGHPWAIQTSSGLRCLFDTGAAPVIHNLPGSYFCAGSPDDLWGLPSRNSQPWMIYVGPPSATKLSKRVSVTVAWF